MSREIGVIGLGYVGLPLALTFIQKGFRVIGVDANKQKIDALNGERSYLPDVSDETVRNSITQNKLTATTDYAQLSEAEAVILCVPTPLTQDHTPDLTYLHQVGSALSKHLVQGQLIVLESSTYPGTTREVLKPLLEMSGLKVGVDFYLAYSPERINPGNMNFTLETIPKVISGITAACTKRIVELYAAVFADVVPVSSPEAAELTKLLENTYRFVNISLINEFAMLCEKLKIDVWEVITAAKTKPYGFSAFYPGPGIGGHCIPVDPLYLQWSANRIGSNSKFIEYAHDINSSMPAYIVDRIKDSIGDTVLAGKSILVIGVTYKRNIDDVRESSALTLMNLFAQEGAVLSYHDPYVPEITVNGYPLKGEELNERILSDADCVIIATDHSQLPIPFILDHAPLVYDTRGVTRSFNGKGRIVRLGTGMLDDAGG
ncbi:nucleotide sugar dehydrogenase [Paenibacillus spongiae]|uniref:Nucleotide sugar dehydrogenase n=1 Tax=Paenibacillus spongiae TaxID=2909671 RepID=A0ABY5S7C8_9BACL|nr:nucleotide sugar dehydrogenase [Paenibacillus spongiae]UVI28623.1 nucleotide sugar dehydrogenase [Paenibacillus spongiae]